jgi:hypothetical protein
MVDASRELNPLVLIAPFISSHLSILFAGQFGKDINLPRYRFSTLIIGIAVWLY